MENPIISVRETSISVWEDSVDEKSMKARIMTPVINRMQARGWIITKDPDIEKNYKCLSPWRRIGIKGDLHCFISISGRHFEVEMWQEINTTNPNGGRYDFDKRARMPYLLGKKCDLEMQYIYDFLKSKTEYESKDARGHKKETSAQFIQRQYAESWHTVAELGRPTWHSDHSRKSADGELLEHEQIVWFIDRKGRWNRGKAYYNINNMWWVVLNKYEHTNLACFDLHVNCPGDVDKKQDHPRRRKILESLLQKALKSLDLDKAQTLKGVLYGTNNNLWRIWSNKHSAWYASEFAGYSDDVLRAGLYTESEAHKEVARCGDILKAVKA